MAFEGRLTFVREKRLDFSSGVSSSDNEPGINSSRSPSSTATPSREAYVGSRNVWSCPRFEVHDIIAPSDAERPERDLKSIGSFCSATRKLGREPGAEKGDVDSNVTWGELPADTSADCGGWTIETERGGEPIGPKSGESGPRVCAAIVRRIVGMSAEESLGCAADISSESALLCSACGLGLDGHISAID